MDAGSDTRMSMAMVNEVTADSDAQDVVAAQHGDKEAFARLIRRHAHSINNCLSRFTHDPIMLQDLWQETCLQAYRSISTYKHQGPFSGWLWRIGLRMGYRFWNQRTKETLARSAYREGYRHRFLSTAPWHLIEDSDHIQMLLAPLGRMDRILIEMKYLQGFNAVEIAHSTGWNESRIRVRLHRALKNLRRFHQGVSSC